MRRNTKNQKGLTLVEILIVLGIIGTVMTVLAPRIFGSRDKSKVKITKLQMGKIGSALEEFYSDCDQYPESLDQLLTAPSSDVCESWGPVAYLKSEKDLLDQWKTPYSYSLEGGNYILISYGKDKEPDGEGFDADLSSEDL